MSADLSVLANHLWQSTAFAGVIALFALALRKNHASIRYGLWLTASVKFLVPFSLLIAAGQRIEFPATRLATPVTLNSIAAPFPVQPAVTVVPAANSAAAPPLAPGR